MTLIVGVLQLTFHLPGCSSLKEKRGRTRGMRDRFGKHVNVAVCESDHADTLQRAQWSFVTAGSDRKLVQQTLEGIEREVASSVDAVITDRLRDIQ